MTIQRFLVGLDGSALAESILPAVRGLAARLGAEIVLLHAVHVPESFRAEADMTLDGVVEHERREADRHLRRVAHELGGTPVAVRTAVVIGEPAAEIVRCAEREHIDVVALATHGRSGVQRWLHGSVADAVLHTSTRPLLLLRPTDAAAAPVPDVRRLIVPLDGSPLAEEVLPVACELARRLAVPLELVRVVEVMSLAFAGDPYGGFSVDYPRVVKALEDGAASYLESVAARVREAGTVETTVTTGVAAEALTRHAAARPGCLVVIGSHGRSGWRAAVLGSVARRVVLLAAGPVLVLRPAAARA